MSQVCVRAERRGCFRSSDTSPRAAGNEGDPKGSFASCSQFAQEEIVNIHWTESLPDLSWKTSTLGKSRHCCIPVWALPRALPRVLHRVGEGQVWAPQGTASAGLSHSPRACPGHLSCRAVVLEPEESPQGRGHWGNRRQAGVGEAVEFLYFKNTFFRQFKNRIPGVLSVHMFQR